MRIVAASMMLIPALAFAAPFDGTWVSNVDSFKITGKPDAYLVANGTYQCDACYPGLKIKADGTDQKVTGHDYYDTVSATIVDPQSVKVVSHAAGKLYVERTLTVSPDGKKLTEEFTQYDGPKPVSGKLNYTRVAAGPAGAHSLSGSWQSVTAGDTMSADLLTWTLTETADGLKMSTPTGQSYDAKFDGNKYLIAGDPGKTMVVLKRINAHTIQETDSRHDKVTDVTTYTLSADGKTIHVVDEDKLHHTRSTFTQSKQNMP